MKKVLFLLFILLITAVTSFKTSYALFSDSVAITFDLRVGEFEIEPFEVISGKPIDFENAKPGEWSDFGIMKLREAVESDTEFYMYAKKINGNVCRAVDIKLEVSADVDVPEDAWTEIYNGRLDDIQPEKNKVVFEVDGENPEIFYLRQSVKLNNDAGKNDEGKDCEWDEIFIYNDKDSSDEKKLTIQRNKLSAGYWVNPAVEVKAPNGGEKFKQGDKMTIKWKAISPTHNKNDLIKVDIYLYDEEGVAVRTIAEDQANDGQHEWTVPGGFNGKYKIKIFITDAYGLSEEDSSDRTFTITGDVEGEPEITAESFSLPTPDPISDYRPGWEDDTPPVNTEIIE